jgi:uncharacterized protein YjiS (DUF1127 family)
MQERSIAMLRTLPITISNIDLARTLMKLAGMICHSQVPAAQRYRLAEMDQRALEDIGLSRGQALAEARKPFWSR